MDAKSMSGVKETESAEELAASLSRCTVTQDEPIADSKSEKEDPGLESAALNDDDDDDENDDEYESTPEDDGDGDEDCRRETEESMTEEEKQEKKTEALGHKTQGNELFKDTSYSKALNCYSRALRICPLCFTSERSILYANKAACFQHLDENDDAITACTKALDLNPAYIKARLRRANLYEKTEKLDEALEDYKKILEYDPMHREAFSAARELPQRINERNEKLKAEMLGKLKDLGNMVLRPFGLSTDNFKLQQDPNTGGYSVNFQQNAQQ